MPIRKASCTAALLTGLLSSHLATAETTLRIAMTASDIPTATGLPNNGFEGMRFLGKDEVLDELFTSFTEDPANAVRDRAGCNISDCGIFTRKQRMRMVPKLLDLVMNPRTTGQMRSWTFLALQEITDENLPADALLWSRWYQEHGSEKLAEFERLEWWQVRGDE